MTTNTYINQSAMNKFWFFMLCLMAFFSIECCAVNSVRFKIDMKKTIDCGLFSPLEKDSVIIRGSFNRWSNNNYVLEDIDRDGIYENVFAIKSDSGVVQEYKYCIVKSNGLVLWEKCPNKNNPPHGNRFLDIARVKTDTFDINRYHLGLTGQEVVFSEQEIKSDFKQFRRILEEEHCCLYEYTGKEEFDRLFDYQNELLTRPMSPIEFYKILTPITAKIGCGHTTVWMPDGFWDCGRNNLFPLKIHLIEGEVVIAGHYEGSPVIQRGCILQEINGVRISDVIQEVRTNYSADAMNIHFINSQIERRFPLIYARRFGFMDKFQIKYIPPDRTTPEIQVLLPASVSAVRSVVFSNFRHPPLQMDIADSNIAVLKIPTFIYYDRVSYFTNFIDSCFTLIKTRNILNLILDLRGNDGGDPFCAAPLFSYLQRKPEPYFAEPYGKYSELAAPLPLPKNHFTGNLFTLIDGRCFSTNGHFCSLLYYHKIGKFIGTESGATYKCNAGKNTEIHLDNTDILLIFGRSTFAAGVRGMDKTKPIVPDYRIRETYQDFLQGRDVVMEKALNLINGTR